jgi:arylsulfatase A
MNLRHLIIVLISACHFFSSDVLAQTKSRPNIVLIVADDLGYGDVGCYGQQKMHTPQIDALAKEGLRFTQFYSGTSVCAPSRASLMTGLHTGHTPIRGNRGFKPEGQFPLPEGTITLPALLKQQGYTTAAFGKWGLGYPGSSGVPNNQGFDEFYGYNCQSQAHNYFPDHIWHNGQWIDWIFNRTADSLYAADNIHQKALDFIAEQHEKPFFLFLPYTLPHGDLDVPHDSVYQAYVKQFNEQPVPKPARVKPGDRHEPYPHAAFAAMVSRLDTYVGDIRKAIAAAGLEKNTLIIFTSDNGPHHEDGGDPVFFNGSGGLRGIKRDLFEGGIRVPTIACMPGKIKTGTTDQPAAFWDLLPTLCEIAGLKNAPNKIDGISILPTLFGKSKQVQHDFFYWEFHENNGRQALRMGNWKAVIYNAGLQKPDEIMLFDLNSDPFEKMNVAAAHPVVVAKMKSMIQREHVQNKNWPLLHGEAGPKEND